MYQKILDIAYKVTEQIPAINNLSENLINMIFPTIRAGAAECDEFNAGATCNYNDCGAGVRIQPQCQWCCQLGGTLSCGSPYNCGSSYCYGYCGG